MGLTYGSVNVYSGPDVPVNPTASGNQHPVAFAASQQLPPSAAEDEASMVIPKARTGES